MSLRIATAGDIPRFVHDGLEVIDRWRDFDFAKAEKPAQQAFIDHTGRYIQVHPADVGNLAKLGLEFYVDEKQRKRLRRIAPASKSKT